ncbi:hypothetical protein BD289DRAFT_430684 [Coniella lustricola]|uniref:Uncharacterized protein n=1 Tax=Coniella lustricola TaxID=2025994 RepID=A0A2T3ABM9_9PEZI|nr:hypothetical protein BD289DRAFT_430684 [Coniella lustricola]
MAHPASADAPPVQDIESILCAFHYYRWDLDKDFLGGLILALGGYRALTQTASQADIIMHTRTFYFAHVRGQTVPYGVYRAWLRSQFLSGQQPRIWEWTLLESLCAHRDKLAATHAGVSTGAAGAPPPPPPSQPQQQAAAAAAQKETWMRQLLNAAGPLDVVDVTFTIADSAAAPDWMKAAPKSELYVDRAMAADGDDEGDPDPAQVPYPERFAAIIKAVQSGEPVEGIEQIPDIVARNPTTKPVGSMERPRKPWEKVQPAKVGTLEQGQHGLDVPLDQSFPHQDETG